MYNLTDGRYLPSCSKTSTDCTVNAYTIDQCEFKKVGYWAFSQRIMIPDMFNKGFII